MKGKKLWLVLVSLCFMGCEAHRHLREGDTALLAKRPRAAVRHYLQAVEAEPGLARSMGFAAKLRYAEARAAHAEGKMLAEQGAWEQAIKKYLQAIEADGQYEHARRSLGKARREASRIYYEKALEHSQHSRFNPAIEQLKRALEIDPDNDRARETLNAVLKQDRERKAKAVALYEQSLVLQRQRRWRPAVELLEKARNLDPSHLHARAAFHQAKQMVERSESARRKGESHLAAKRLGRSITSLKEALEIWPFNEQAQQRLVAVQSRRDQVQNLLEDATALWRGSRWDDALQSANAAQQIFPHHAALAELVQRIKHEAAAAWTRQGRQLLATDDLEGAEAAFGRALDYRPDGHAVRKDLAKINLTRGDTARAKAQWGRALLWYMAASDHFHDVRAREKLNAIRAKILDGVRFGLTVKADERSRDSESFVAAVQSQISATKPAYINLDSSPDQEPIYTAILNMVSLDVQERHVHTERKRYAYTDYRMVENARIFRLRGQLQSAQRHLAHLRRQPVCILRCTVCAGAGTVVCSTCKGARFIRCGRCRGTCVVVVETRPPKCQICRGRGRILKSCSHCGGRGKIIRGEEIRKDKDRRRRQLCAHCRGRGKRFIACLHSASIVVSESERKTCDRCRGRGRLSCQTCRHTGKITCGRCRGTGRYSISIRSKLHQQDAEIRRLRHRLTCEPATVRQSYHAHWPYRDHRYRKSGSLTAQLAVKETASDVVIGSHSVRQQFHQEDSTVEHANPGIGLSEDGLNLLSDEQTRRYLLDRASCETASKIISVVAIAHAANLQQQARARAADGDIPKSIEAKVAAALVLEPVDVVAATRLLSKLRRD